MPHANVEVKDFYKLIEQSLPERKRMRHLLIWCGTRALLDKRPLPGQSTIETIAIESGMLKLNLKREQRLMVLQHVRYKKSLSKTSH